MGQLPDRQPDVAPPTSPSPAPPGGQLPTEPDRDPSTRGAVGDHAAAESRGGVEQAPPRPAEDRLRTILQSIDDTITIVGPDGRMRAGTGLVTSILGYDPEFWREHDVFDVIHPDDIPGAMRVLAEIAATPGSRATAEMRVRASDGSWQLAEGTAVNLLDDADVQGILLTTRNITERRRNELLAHGQADVLRLVAQGAPLVDTLHEITGLVDALSSGGRCVLTVADRTGTTAVSASISDPRPVALLGRQLGVEAQDRPFVVETGPRGTGQTSGDRPAGGDAGEDRRRPDGDEGHPASHPAPGRDHLVDSWRSCWVAPIRSPHGRRPPGWLVCLFDRPTPPGNVDLELASVAADLAAIAIEREDAERRLARLALHDELTGLANRHLLLNRLDQAIQRARRHEHRLAVLFLDLDRFKAINDSLGHEGGDLVLREVAERLRQAVRPEDTVARFGGDEFVVLVERVDDEGDVGLIADRLARCLARPFQVGETEVFVTASVGVALDDGGESGSNLLRSADIAMYRAKEQGRNRLEVFDERLRTQLVERLELEAALRAGVAEGELRLGFEPTHDLDDDRVVNWRARVEWLHPTRGVVPHDDLVAVAENTGLAFPIGSWALERSLAAISADRMGGTTSSPDETVRAGWGAGRIGAGRGADLTVELSGRQLAQPGLVEQVGAALARHRWPPERLLLGLTEEVVGRMSETGRANVEGLAGIGVGLAVDEFGSTGSSLQALCELPIRELAVSWAVIGETTVRAAQALAHVLGARFVVDGLDTAEHVAAARALGCGTGRGRAVGAAVPGERFEAPRGP